MHRKPRLGTYRFADFLELVHSDQKADLLDGTIYMASPENTEHNDLVGWLSTVIRQYLEEKNLGRVTVNKVAFRLNDANAPEPDLGIVLGERVKILKHGYVDGPPDVAVEIVSPDSVDRDYEEKRVKYEEAGVAEYWILDIDERQATFLKRGEGAGVGFSEYIVQDSIYRSSAIAGFWLDVNWLWSRPRPNTRSVVERLLVSQ